MGSMLENIQDFVDRFAKTISDVLDTDVIITDSKLKIVGSHFRYFSLYNEVKIESLIARVLISNKMLLIEDKSKEETCKACREFKQCKIKGFIGVSVRYENRSVGVIALELPRFKVKEMFDHVESTIEFMENMSELLSARIGKEEETIKLKKEKLRTETILNMVDEAMVYTDIYGNVIFLNAEFVKTFHVTDDLIGKNIVNKFPIFGIWLRNRKPIENEKVSIPCGNEIFYGMVTSKKLYSNASEYGMLFVFRSYSNIYSTGNDYTPSSLVTFEWLQGFLDQHTISYIKTFAEKEDHLLICSDDNAINELIAKAIFNASPRRLENMRVVYMQNVYRDLMDKYFMDEYGLINNTDRGTLIIVQPEKMTLYVQDRLADYIQQGEKKATVYKIRSNVQFIFCTTANLETMTLEGKFSRRLYGEISRNTIENIDTVHNDYYSFTKFVISGFRYYSGLYGKNEKDFIKPEILENLWRRYKGLPLGDIETIVEKFVRDNELTEIQRPEEKQISSMKEIEKKQMLTLLKNGYSKKEIAQMLDISRTTLYRRLKKYNLLDKAGE